MKSGKWDKDICVQGAVLDVFTLKITVPDLTKGISAPGSTPMGVCVPAG